MKRFIYLLSILVLVFSITLVGCGSDNDTKPHTHKIIAVKGVEPTGISDGYKNHFKCEGCNKIFADSKGENEISISEITIAKHVLSKIERVEASSTSVGNVEYYKCLNNGCGKLFIDSEGKTEIGFEDTLLVNFISKNVEYVYVEIPDVISGAEEIEFYEYFIEDETDAMAGQYTMSGEYSKDGYVYLKRFNQGDFIVEFEIDYAGVYEFGFEIFSIVLNDPERRVTNIQIDNSEYVMLDCFHPKNDNGLRQFAYGISAYLSEGKHKVKLNLPDVFDDETVKSLYIHAFYYAPASE